MLSHADGSFAKVLENLARVNLLILDDWLRDPLTVSQRVISWRSSMIAVQGVQVFPGRGLAAMDHQVHLTRGAASC